MKFKYFEDKNINVRDYIVKNYTPYDGNEEFLEKPTKNTLKLWDELSTLMKEERERGGVWDIDTKTISVKTVSDSATANTPKKGHGYARITYLGTN